MKEVWHEILKTAIEALAAGIIAARFMHVFYGTPPWF